MENYKKYIQKQIDALNSLKESITNDLDLLINEILNVKGFLIITGVGKNNHIGNKISSTLASLGTPSFFIHPSEASHGDLGRITKNDALLCLSNSGETKELYDIIEYAKRNGIKIFSITSNKNSLLGKNSDIVLELPKVNEACTLNLAPTSTTTMTLVLGDTIAIELLNRKQFTKYDFSNFHPGGKLGKTLIKINDIMYKDNLPLISPEETIINSLLLMAEKKYGIVGIIENNKLIGVITDGDIRRNCLNINKFKAKDIMNNNPITINKEMLAVEALHLMNEKRITSLFVLENNDVIGCIHIHDLIKLGF